MLTLCVEREYCKLAFNNKKKLIAVSSGDSEHAYIEIYGYANKAVKFLDEYKVSCSDLKADMSKDSSLYKPKRL